MDRNGYGRQRYDWKSTVVFAEFRTEIGGRSIDFTWNIFQLPLSICFRVMMATAPEKNKTS